MTKKKSSAKKPPVKKAGKSNIGYAEPKKKKAVKRSPRQASLVGMEDRAIEVLESQARDIKDIDAEITGLRKDRETSMDALIASMKKFGKTVYHHDGITINLKDQTKAQVKVKKVIPPEPEKAAPDIDVDVAVEA